MIPPCRAASLMLFAVCPFSHVRGTTVQVLVERGRVTLISEAVEEACTVRPDDGRPTAADNGILLLTHEHLDAQLIHDGPRSTSRRGGE